MGPDPPPDGPWWAANHTRRLLVWSPASLVCSLPEDGLGNSKEPWLGEAPCPGGEVCHSASLPIFPPFWKIPVTIIRLCKDMRKMLGNYSWVTMASEKICIYVVLIICPCFTNWNHSILTLSFLRQLLCFHHSPWFSGAPMPREVNYCLQSHTRLMAESGFEPVQSGSRAPEPYRWRCTAFINCTGEVGVWFVARYRKPYIMCVSCKLQFPLSRRPCIHDATAFCFCILPLSRGFVSCSCLSILLNVAHP